MVDFAPIPALAAAFDRQPRLREVFSARVAFAAAPADALLLAQPDITTLTDWLAAEVSDIANPDDKLAAAYFVNRLGWAVSEPLCWLALDAVPVPAIKVEVVALTSRRETWEKDGETGVSIAYDLVIDPDRLGAGLHPLTPDALGEVIAELFAPLVTSVAIQSGLSRGALWRLVGDGLSATLLAQGKAIGAEDLAMDIARAILGNRATPLFSRQTGFVRISLPERPDIAEWFRARGGCCRFYTREDGNYCTTCVLRDADSRNLRLQNHLRTKNGIEVPEVAT